MKDELIYKIAQEVVKSRNQGNRTTTIVKINRPEGRRFYKGVGIGRGSMSKSKAIGQAMWKSKHTPGDSVTTNYMKYFKEIK